MAEDGDDYARGNLGRGESEISWDRVGYHLTREVRRLADNIHDLRDEINPIRSDLVSLREAVSALKVKAGIWGIVGGGIPVLIGMGVWIIHKALTGGP